MVDSEPLFALNTIPLLPVLEKKKSNPVNLLAKS